MSYDDFYSCEDRFFLALFTLTPCLCFTGNTPFWRKLNHVYLTDSLYKPETMTNTGSSRIVKHNCGWRMLRVLLITCWTLLQERATLWKEAGSSKKEIILQRQSSLIVKKEAIRLISGVKPQLTSWVAYKRISHEELCGQLICIKQVFINFRSVY